MQLKNNIILGVGGAAALLTLYFTVVSLISGAAFAISQFQQFWYYIVPLAIGFGIQVGMFSYLRQAGKTLVVTGTASTGAMLACCAHYLANIAPLVAAAGVITFIAQYQVQFFWVGPVFNLVGIISIARKIQKP